MQQHSAKLNYAKGKVFSIWAGSRRYCCCRCLSPCNTAVVWLARLIQKCCTFVGLCISLTTTLVLCCAVPPQTPASDSRVTAAISKNATLPNDVHIQVSDPLVVNIHHNKERSEEDGIVSEYGSGGET